MTLVKIINELKKILDNEETYYDVVSHKTNDL